MCDDYSQKKRIYDAIKKYTYQKKINETHTECYKLKDQKEDQSFAGCIESLTRYLTTIEEEIPKDHMPLEEVLEAAHRERSDRRGEIDSRLNLIDLTRASVKQQQIDQR